MQRGRVFNAIKHKWMIIHETMGKLFWPSLEVVLQNLFLLLFAAALMENGLSFFVDILCAFPLQLKYLLYVRRR